MTLITFIGVFENYLYFLLKIQRNNYLNNMKTHLWYRILRKRFIFLVHKNTHMGNDKTSFNTNLNILSVHAENSNSTRDFWTFPTLKWIKKFFMLSKLIYELHIIISYGECLISLVFQIKQSYSLNFVENISWSLNHQFVMPFLKGVKFYPVYWLP